ncbi:hypothetical protein L1987_20002 [Smallanthus sonchifolius]|uniref:Uncharacterized protein n=1 Tax=Smallanthus sonchifolius TaxID=185202 RepID=A0ACB9IQV6_9ASTR|nr:hypothetical protein L1987_20002 [Smallanthus sonchifolius]
MSSVEPRSSLTWSFKPYLQAGICSAMADPADIPLAPGEKPTTTQTTTVVTGANPYLIDMSLVESPIMVEVSELDTCEAHHQSEGEPSITLDFLRKNRERLKAQLDELERIEELSGVQTRLTYESPPKMPQARQPERP